MIKYGSDRITELKFASFQPRIEQRADGQWVDIELRFTLTKETAELAPTDLIDLTILIICSRSGQIAQIVPQDEGCDCEYQFTSSEKEQIETYIYSEAVQQLILKSVTLT